jgi:Leucine-rich repeat (LRR) protein
MTKEFREIRKLTSNMTFYDRQQERRWGGGEREDDRTEAVHMNDAQRDSACLPTNSTGLALEKRNLTPEPKYPYHVDDKSMYKLPPTQTERNAEGPRLAPAMSVQGNRFGGEVPPGLPVGSPHFYVGKGMEGQRAEAQPIDEKSMFKRSHGLIDSTALSERRISTLVAQPSGAGNAHASMNATRTSTTPATSEDARYLDDKSIFKIQFDQKDRTAFDKSRAPETSPAVVGDHQGYAPAVLEVLSTSQHGYHHDEKSKYKLSYDRTKSTYRRAPEVFQQVDNGPSFAPAIATQVSGVTPGLPQGSPHVDVGKRNGLRREEVHLLDEKSTFKRAHDLIDRTALNEHRTSVAPSLGAFAEPGIGRADRNDENEPDSVAPSFLANVVQVSEYFSNRQGVQAEADDKSMFNRAYDLIDHTALSIRSMQSMQSLAESSKAGEDGPSIASSKAEYHQGPASMVSRRRLVEADAASTYSSAVSTYSNAASTRTASSHSNAASSYTASTHSNSASTYSKGPRPERFNQVPLAPGAEYVPTRAPGSATPLFLEMMRRENLRRAQEARQAARQRLTSQQPAIESQRELHGLPDATTPQSPISGVREEEPIANQGSELKTPHKNRCVVWTVVIAFILAVASAGMGIAFAVTKKKGSTAAVTQFNPYTMNCSSLSSQLHPHVVSQCHCQGTIFSLAEDIASRYILLTETFITTLYPDFHESLDSCTPQNQALVWLASGDGGSTDATMRQRYVLALLFILWNGEAWKSNDGWLFSDSECMWTGVSCGENEAVVAIDLHNNSLAGEFGSDVSLLTSLTSLSLSQNNLRGNLTSELGNLSALEVFTIDDNELTGTLPSAFGQLSQLQELDLGYNRLNGTIPTWIGQLQRLSTLVLSHNALFQVRTETKDTAQDRITSGTIPTQIGLLTSLQTLDLSSTGTSGTLPTELFNIGGSLQILNVSGNFLSGSIPTLVGNLAFIGTWMVVDLTYVLICGTDYSLLVAQNKYPFVKIISPVISRKSLDNANLFLRLTCQVTISMELCRVLWSSL